MTGILAQNEEKCLIFFYFTILLINLEILIYSIILRRQGCHSFNKRIEIYDECLLLFFNLVGAVV